MNEEKERDLYTDESGEAQNVGNGPNSKPEPTKAGNIVSLISAPKSRRVVIATAVALLLVGAVSIVSISSKNKQRSPELPPSLVGADVGSAPVKLEDVSNSALAESKQYQDIVAQAAQSRASEAAAAGQSQQPLAITVESALRPSQTPAELEAKAAKDAKDQLALAMVQEQTMAAQNLQRQAAAGQQYQSANQAQMDAMAQQTIQNASAAVNQLTANRVRGGQVFTLYQVGSQSEQSPNGAQTRAAYAQSQVTPGAVDASQAANSSQAAPQQYTLVGAGTIESARIDTAVNTDVGGQFGATLVTGKYAGAKLIGNVQRRGELAQLSCTMMSFPGQGVSIPASCSILDAESGEGGTASDVDRKLFVKYGVKPLAAGFAAVGEYMKTAGTSVIINGSSTSTSQPELTGKKTGQLVLGSAAGQLSADTDALDTTPVVRVYRGAIVGVFFSQDVTYTPKSR